VVGAHHNSGVAFVWHTQDTQKLTVVVRVLTIKVS
jgi:hypothetical protein